MPRADEERRVQPSGLALENRICGYHLGVRPLVQHTDPAEREQDQDGSDGQRGGDRLGHPFEAHAPTGARKVVEREEQQSGQPQAHEIDRRQKNVGPGSLGGDRDPQEGDGQARTDTADRKPKPVRLESSRRDRDASTSVRELIMALPKRRALPLLPEACGCNGSPATGHPARPGRRTQPCSPDPC